MEKNAKLASIYVKIYNKRTLTIDRSDVSGRVLIRSVLPRRVRT